MAVIVSVIAFSCLLVVVAVVVYYIRRRRRRRRQTSVEPAAPDAARRYVEVFGRPAGTDRRTIGGNVRLSFPRLQFVDDDER